MAIIYDRKAPRFTICDYDGVKNKKIDTYFIRKNKMACIKISRYDVLHYYIMMFYIQLAGVGLI